MEKDNFKIELTKFNTYALAVKFKNIKEDLTKAYFTVKENPDDEPILQKALGSGITKIDDKEYKSEKTYKLQLESIDTQNFDIDVQYLYDLQVTIGSVVKTIISGFFVVKQSVTGYPHIATEDAEVNVEDVVEADFETIATTNGLEYESDPIAMKTIGSLTDLKTNVKSSVVGAINELQEEADRNNDEIEKLKNGVTVIGSSKNVTEQINGKKITDIFESNGTTVKSSTSAMYSQYASPDTTKGTIEERLTALGFKEGAFTIVSGSAITNEIKKQGKWVRANFMAHSNQTIVRVPDEFCPKENTLLTSVVYVSGLGYLGGEVVITTDGKFVGSDSKEIEWGANCFIAHNSSWEIN